MKLLSLHGVIIIIRHHSQDKYTIFLYFTNDSLITFIYWTNITWYQNVSHIQITYIVVCFIISKQSVNKYRCVTRNRLHGLSGYLAYPMGQNRCNRTSRGNNDNLLSKDFQYLPLLVFISCYRILLTIPKVNCPFFTSIS